MQHFFEKRPVICKRVWGHVTFLLFHLQLPLGPNTNTSPAASSPAIHANACLSGLAFYYSSNGLAIASKILLSRFHYVAALCL